MAIKSLALVGVGRMLVPCGLNRGRLNSRNRRVLVHIIKMGKTSLLGSLYQGLASAIITMAATPFIFQRSSKIALE